MTQTDKRLEAMEESYKALYADWLKAKHDVSDMLEVLEAVERLLPRGWPYNISLSIAECETVRAAIAKAKGA